MGEARRRKLAGNTEPKVKLAPVAPIRKVGIVGHGNNSTLMLMAIMAGMMQPQVLPREIMREMKR